MDTLIAAVVSSRSRFCDTEANLKHFASLTRRAAGRDARLVCFPELALSSYTTRPEALEVAEKIPGPSTEALCEIAAAYDVFVSMGMPERAGSEYHIAQVVVGPEGKHHPTGDEQACGFSPGKSFPTFTIDGFRIGINICADGRQAGTVEALRKKRVDVILHPHGNVLSLGRNSEEWTRGKMVYFVPRAIHARAYVLVNNSAGDTVDPGGRMRFGSGALAIDPLGQVVKRTVQTTRSEKMIVVDLERPLDRMIPDFEMERLGGRS